MLTPGITRHPARLLEFDKQRVGGRVHAVVRPRIETQGREGMSSSVPIFDMLQKELLYLIA
jgi:hypothetical protein